VCMGFNQPQEGRIRMSDLAAVIANQNIYYKKRVVKFITEDHFVQHINITTNKV
jgi:hypothetical protein